eukprot:m.129470 g.129470  ORF g.129470 m.129470 type:complete len:81 (+) comp16761_c1_seq6:516-758(+)
MAASSDDELPSYDVVKHQQFSIPDSAISVKLSESVDWTLDVSKTDSIFDVKRRIQARNGVNRTPCVWGWLRGHCAQCNWD